MLVIKGIKKAFDKHQVLKGINLEIQPGEITVIVGPSGGGKTTLLRCINLLLTPEEGTIQIDGKVLFEEGKKVSKKIEQEIRKDIGLVFQNFNLFPHLNVLENMMEAPRRVLGKSKDDAEKKSKEILSFLGLEGKERNYPCELSGGQKQRVAIGRALAMDPKVLCFDEPTSALDPGLSGEVAHLIQTIAKESKMAVLIITHDMEFAKQVSHRILSMKDGNLIAESMY